MSFFDKLFGKNPGGDDVAPDIESLLGAEDKNKAVIDLDTYISKLCEHGASLDKLNEAQKVFFLNQNLERQVNNGGFHQFYGNSSGDNAMQTVEALRVVGAAKTANLLLAANEQFPDGVVPSDRDQREQVLEEIEDRASDVWSELDRQFYKYEDDLNALNLEFVRSRVEDFS